MISVNKEEVINENGQYPIKKLKLILIFLFTLVIGLTINKIFYFINCLAFSYVLLMVSYKNFLLQFKNVEFPKNEIYRWAVYCGIGCATVEITYDLVEYKVFTYLGYIGVFIYIIYFGNKVYRYMIETEKNKSIIAT